MQPTNQAIKMQSTQSLLLPHKRLQDRIRVLQPLIPFLLQGLLLAPLPHRHRAVLQPRQVGVDLPLDRLLVVLDSCPEDELEEVVEQEGTLEVVGLAEGQEVEGLDFTLAEPARVLLLVFFFVLEEGVELVQGKSACGEALARNLFVVLELRVLFLSDGGELRRFLAHVAVGRGPIPALPEATLNRLDLQLQLILPPRFLRLLAQHRSGDDGNIYFQLGQLPRKTNHLDQIVLVDQSVPVLVEDGEGHPEAHLGPHSDQLVDAVLGLPIGDELRKRKRKIQLDIHSILLIRYLSVVLSIVEILLQHHQNALLGKRAQKGIFSLFAESLPGEGAGFLGQLPISFLVDILQVAAEQFVPAADHIVDGLLIDGRVRIVLEPLHMVLILLRILTPRGSFLEEGEAPVEAVHGANEPIDLIPCDIDNIILSVILRSRAGRTQPLSTDPAQIVMLRGLIPLRDHPLPQGVPFLLDHGVALLPHPEQPLP